MYSSSISETSNFKSAASLRYITMELSVSDLISVNVRPIFSPFSHFLTLDVSIPSFSKKSVTNVPSWSSDTRAKKPHFLPSLASPTAIFAGEPPRYLLKVVLSLRGQ